MRMKFIAFCISGLSFYFRFLPYLRTAFPRPSTSLVSSTSSGSTTGTCVRAPGNDGGRSNQGGMFFRTGTPDSNGTEVWGGGQNLCLGSYKAPQISAVAYTPIDDLSRSQTNGQTFTASGPYRTVCITVTDFSGLKSDADGAGDGNALIGGFIAQHPFGDGLWWNVIGQGSCPYVTWTYASGYQVPDNTAQW